MSLYVKFQLPNMSRSSWKVCEGGGVGWSRPRSGISFSQAEQNFDFLGHLLTIIFYILFPVAISDQTQKKHAISINIEHVRSPRVQRFWWHSPNRDVHPGEFKPYMVLKHLIFPEMHFKANLFFSKLIFLIFRNLQEDKFCWEYIWCSENGGS